jgi:hypothetical protein
MIDGCDGNQSNIGLRQAHACDGLFIGVQI